MYFPLKKIPGFAVLVNFDQNSQKWPKELKAHKLCCWLLSVSASLWNFCTLDLYGCEFALQSARLFCLLESLHFLHLRSLRLSFAQWFSGILSRKCAFLSSWWSLWDFCTLDLYDCEFALQSARLFCLLESLHFLHLRSLRMSFAQWFPGILPRKYAFLSSWWSFGVFCTLDLPLFFKKERKTNRARS